MIEQLTRFAIERNRDIDDVLEQWAERAAIREFDGGYSREEAEALALKDVMR